MLNCSCFLSVRIRMVDVLKRMKLTVSTEKANLKKYFSAVAKHYVNKEQKKSQSVFY